METDQELLEANERLLKKREELKVTGQNIPLMENTVDVIRQIGDRIMGEMQERTQDPTEVIQISSPYKPEEPKPYKASYPKKYNECTFDNFKGNEKLIKDLIRHTEEKKSIVLMGNTGCGKTHLAIAISKATITYDGWNHWDTIPGTVFITVPELLLKARASFRDDSTISEEKLIRHHSSCDLLVLDDLGSEKTSEYAITTLYLILDRRIRDEKQTIITTNFDNKQIEEIFGARIASRLAEMVNIKINMPDYRKKR